MKQLVAATLILCTTLANALSGQDEPWKQRPPFEEQSRTQTLRERDKMEDTNSWRGPFVGVTGGGIRNRDDRR